MSLSGIEAPDEHDDLDGIPRPSSTLRLVGQDAAWRDLVTAQASGRMHHAWLLQGPRGIGKATAAFAFARRLLSRTDGDGGTAPTIGNEAIARQIAQGSQPNLVHLTRPPAERGNGFKTQITVEEVRKLNRFFHTTSAGGQWRVAIVDPADDMNRNAANALLKILEEPPERSIFLITNHLPGRLLATIRSRCRVLRFEAMSEERIVEAMLAMQLPSHESEVRAAAALAEGSVRTAVALLSGGSLETEARIDRVWSASEADWAEIHALADILTLKGRDAAFELAVAGLFARLAKEAETRLDGGSLRRGRQLAWLWDQESRRLRDGMDFNIDRRQMLLTFFLRLFEIRATA